MERSMDTTREARLESLRIRETLVAVMIVVVTIAAIML
jgi:hypothetical protein